MTMKRAPGRRLVSGLGFDHADWLGRWPLGLTRDQQNDTGSARAFESLLGPKPSGAPPLPRAPAKPSPITSVHAQAQPQPALKDASRFSFNRVSIQELVPTQRGGVCILSTDTTSQGVSHFFRCETRAKKMARNRASRGVSGHDARGRDGACRRTRDWLRLIETRTMCMSSIAIDLFVHFSDCALFPPARHWLERPPHLTKSS